MLKYENLCCDCSVSGYPCEGESCPRRNTPVFYCDICGKECSDDEVYHINNMDYCKECFLKGKEI